MLIFPSQDYAEPQFEDACVLTRPGTTLAEQCALELFSYFMEEIASRIEKIGGQTETVLNDPSSDRSIRHANSVFDSIARICLKAGLAHDIQEALAVIIPAFFKHGLLPEVGAQHPKWPRDEYGRQMVLNSLSIPEDLDQN